ncbi:hypothetical protein GCK72_022887 [Caenorhabditis remanei]|uniref:MBD domain-containing protein n=1 Tax=Caenorhabditis remanei TaxID=31234 RepID=A0A6A5FV44_CAERE|nr:hypothetical protein GCK72_022887 [Caenorhabditis remanei]KAF1746432.1 hypothetical protein GCK72_022887 [Caenorhabditis remanei]
MGRKRQTCARGVTASEVKKDVSYFAPDGRKLSTYLKVVRKTSSSPPKVEESDEPVDNVELHDDFGEELVHSQIMSNELDKCEVRGSERVTPCWSTLTKSGQGGGKMGFDRENSTEVMHLLLEKREIEVSQPLQFSNFLALAGEQKVSGLIFRCYELVCSRSVVMEIEKNLEEISMLKGEKYMREAKTRALRSARSKKKNDEKVVAVVKEEQHLEIDSEPPTRPVTPEKNSAAPVARTASPNISGNVQLRKFTPGLVLVVSLESLRGHNPACTTNKYAPKDRQILWLRASEACESVDINVIGCLEDHVNEVVLQTAETEKKT